MKNSNVSKEEGIVKIGVFYDGNYFLHVSNYYYYFHQRRSRLSISGLHEFIRNHTAAMMSTEPNLCKIVDAHYFRGRLNAQEASQRGNQLYYDRMFDDILMLERVTTHYFPLRVFNSRREEKGVEIMLSMEALELSFFKQFDVLVLIASDGDYVPLVRKLNSLGTRVLLMSWDFEFTDDEGNQRVTKTSSELLKEVNYHAAMHELMEGSSPSIGEINHLFVSSGPSTRLNNPDRQVNTAPRDPNAEYIQSTIHSLKAGYGFIRHAPNNVFFHHSNLLDADFNELEEGLDVEFRLGKNDQGGDIALEVRPLF